MPEVSFSIEWPDGSREACYSPSTVVLEYLAPGTSYPLADFLERCRTALTRASERVEAKYGYRCSSAEDQLQKIERVAARFEPGEQRPVRVLELAVGPPVL